MSRKHKLVPERLQSHQRAYGPDLAKLINELLERERIKARELSESANVSGDWIADLLSGTKLSTSIDVADRVLLYLGAQDRLGEVVRPFWWSTNNWKLGEQLECPEGWQRCWGAGCQGLPHPLEHFFRKRNGRGPQKWKDCNDCWLDRQKEYSRKYERSHPERKMNSRRAYNLLRRQKRKSVKHRDLVEIKPLLPAIYVLNDRIGNRNAAAFVGVSSSMWHRYHTKKALHMERETAKRILKVYRETVANDHRLIGAERWWGKGAKIILIKNEENRIIGYKIKKDGKLFNPGEISVTDKLDLIAA